MLLCCVNIIYNFCKNASKKVAGIATTPATFLPFFLATYLSNSGHGQDRQVFPPRRRKP
jgi:hypothetical protein